MPVSIFRTGIGWTVWQDLTDLSDCVDLQWLHWYGFHSLNFFMCTVCIWVHILPELTFPFTLPELQNKPLLSTGVCLIDQLPPPPFLCLVCLYLTKPKTKPHLLGDRSIWACLLNRMLLHIPETANILHYLISNPLFLS